MEADFAFLERGGTGRGTYWTLRPDLHRRLSAPGYPERDRRIDWEAAKTRVVSVLRQRSQRQEHGLTNAEIRKITHFDRSQVKRLMAELAKEDTAFREGRGRGAKWLYKGEKT
jgi:ATP-dependent DNA helicase RecG